MIDPDTIPLSRFTGPLGYQVKLKDVDEAESQAWRKWLQANLTMLGLTLTPQGKVVAIATNSAGEGVPARERRILLAWLAGQGTVEQANVTRGAAGTGLTIEVSASGKYR